MITFQSGGLAAYNSHPYYKNETSYKITAYADYTPPILIIIESKISKYDADTGLSLGQSVYCAYYNSNNGKLESKWINGNLLNPLIAKPSIFIEDIKFKDNITQKEVEIVIKTIYLNKKVALKSLDLELKKVKAHRSFEKDKFIETNHLEFLPPIMTIIGHRFPDEKKKFCEDTGRLKIDFKCKWYNSASKSFSEEFLPYQVLQLVKETSELFGPDILSDLKIVIESNKLIKINVKDKDVFRLEGRDPLIEIASTILEPTDIYFKHYHYIFQSFNYVSQNKQITKLNRVFETKEQGDVFGASYPSYNNGSRKRVIDCHFNEGQYYLIQYKDQFDRITKRIIKVIDLLIYIKNSDEFKIKYKIDESVNSEGVEFANFYYEEADGSISSRVRIMLNDKPTQSFKLREVVEDINLDCFIVANCLLRKGKFRNFKLNNILSATEIIDGNLLFER
ncbi:hypothetical protein [Flavobacterium psychrotrophum]|uniref:hypothetical protein n=1 Tax=Flavobacterium psychrotrophum TaxID=2294119 RepID=UPI000E310601|nr:hypothetical protein [Flavobacterium psychrotrophum]